MNAAKRAAACDVAAEWNVGSVTFKVLNQQSAAEFLGTSDPFTQALTPFDLEARMKQADTHTESSYLAFAAGSAMEWEPEELANVERSVRRLMTLTSAFNLPLPSEILILKTNGREEFGAAYTRGNAMILPRAVARSADETSKFVDHETYHILSRHSPEFRAAMNGLLGFVSGTPVAVPTIQTVTNPDLGFQQWTLNTHHRGVAVRVTPVLHSPVEARDVRSVYSFRYGLAVQDADGQIAVDGGGRFVELHPDMIGFHDRIGVPRNFPLHPEELMALVFETLLDAQENREAATTLTRPALLDEVLSSPWFLDAPTTRFGDQFPARSVGTRPDQALFPQRGPLSWAEAKAVVERLSKIHEPFAVEKGKTLEMEVEWMGEWDQASAYNYSHSDRMSVSLGGGLARNPMMTQDTFAKIACHELGHLFGGAPTRVSPMKEPNAVELQADYWSTAKCLRRYFGVDGDANLTWVREHPVDPLAREKCERQFRDPVDEAVCMRSVMASLNEVRMLEALSSRQQNTPAALSTPSKKRVSIIERYYTDNQCRLDTLFQGALCRESHTTRASDTDAKQGFCNRSEGDRTGVRPRCWYRAGASVHRMGQTSY